MNREAGSVCTCCAMSAGGPTCGKARCGRLTRSSLTASGLMRARWGRFRKMQRTAAIVFLLVTSAALAQETPAKPPEKPWSSSLGAGIALTSGNSDTKNININFNTAFDPKTDRRFKADALYLRGDSEG